MMFITKMPPSKPKRCPKTCACDGVMIEMKERTMPFLKACVEFRTKAVSTGYEHSEFRRLTGRRYEYDEKDLNVVREKFNGVCDVMDAREWNFVAHNQVLKRLSEMVRAPREVPSTDKEKVHIVLQAVHFYLLKDATITEPITAIAEVRACPSLIREGVPGM